MLKRLTIVIPCMLFIAPTIYALEIKNQIDVNSFSGRLAGIRSVTLKPNLSLDYKLNLSYDKWFGSFQAVAYYGSAITGAGTLKNRPLELDMYTDISYAIYKDRNSRINIGAFAEDYQSLKPFKPQITSSQVVQYADEESEIPSNDNYNFGILLKTAYSYKKISASLYSKVYFYGNRIAPNLIPYAPLLSIGTKDEVFLIGDISNPKFSLCVNMDFYFQRKYGNKFFTSHDGLAGTKREFDISIGMKYYFTKNLDFHVYTYGYNNLNRGRSSTLPSDFKDGVYAGFGYIF
ncbi:hypothetical protein [Hydrogenobacter thermophilus]|uniref:hypothetical protein n=1 Tax=Hydrogenobacter thermophilus TaxID=940 RepID=UPI0030F77160